MISLSKIPLVCIHDDYDEFYHTTGATKKCYSGKLYYTYVFGNTYISVFENKDDEHIEDHYVGYFNTDYFITLADYRQKQIEELLDGEICVYSDII